ncbi:DNA polymerase III subunit alpha [Derxia lacustris]|uniref:DNA polymerase III subunit alpha n=1 Tax=Derxia lacustris TaxID=764842 RepID=UPI000A170F02|nr:DNA polymerase III subunit alpha [Derxia lacustris]
MTETAALAPSSADAPVAPAARFVHLRVHTEYSITDGIVRVDDMVAKAAADRQPALAMTDAGNLFGLVKFYKEARGKGVKPICGCDVTLANPADPEHPFDLLLLVQNRAGYLRLCELLSRAWLTNQVRGRPELMESWLDDGTDGLIALSGAAQGEIGCLLAQGNAAGARAAAQRLAARFPDRFYIELQRSSHPEQQRHVPEAARLAAELGLPIVATHPVQFLEPDDFIAHEARYCVAAGERLNNTRRPKPFTQDQYLRSQDEMAALFADLPAALENTLEIARRCSLQLELGKPKLPQFPTPDGYTLDDWLVHLSKEGLEKRLAVLFPDEAERAARRPEYFARLEFECGTIIKMGFPGYFLIVADFINWAKNNGVPVGPGRGSGAGSLVAYVLGITDLDPLRYNLLFERFLNPERVSMPDFDIDFCQDGRERVIEYVRDKYGAESVSQIATFGTMAAKAALRDVGRVLDMGYGYVDSIAKLVPAPPGKTVTIRKRTNPKDEKTIYAREVEPQIEEREKNEEEVATLLDLAARVEGITRNIGMHAGGVLIAPGKLTDFCPLYVQEGSNVVSQYDKDDVEAVGLVKFDFLGLTTLTILDWAVRYIHRRPGHEQFDLSQTPLDDAGAFEVLKTANTVAVFQLESRGMQDMLIKARPDKFEDIIALVALYRPGPMDLIPSFCDRKHGRERVEYPDPRVESILSETYGIMVYQEQVMQMAQIIGGYSLGGADLLRRAMGKKKAEEMAQHRALFAAGAAKNGITEPKANEMFDLMEKFAGYGFNKSHAAAYALLSYYTAYLKKHFPAEFYAGNMSCAMDDTDKIKILWSDATRNNGLKVLGPDVNLSAYRFEPTDENTIRYGLGAIKGTGEGAILNILEARKAGPFTSLFDFVLRVDKRSVNRRTIEALIRAGAFDSITPDRASLLASVQLAMDFGEQRAASASQNSLFGDDDVVEGEPPLVPCEPWSLHQLLTEEKTVFGFSLSGHLFDAWAGEVRRFARTWLDQVRPSREQQTLAGVISGVRIMMGRRGRMAIVAIDDGRAQQEIMVTGENLDTYRNVLVEDALIVVTGVVRSDEFSGGVRIMVDSIETLAAARARHAKHLRLVVEQPQDGAIERANEFLGRLEPLPSMGVPVQIEVRNGSWSGVLKLPPDKRVLCDDIEIKQLAQAASAREWQLVY